MNPTSSDTVLRIREVAAILIDDLKEGQCGRVDGEVCFVDDRYSHSSVGAIGVVVDGLEVSIKFKRIVLTQSRWEKDPKFTRFVVEITSDGVYNQKVMIYEKNNKVDLEKVIAGIKLQVERSRLAAEDRINSREISDRCDLVYKERRPTQDLIGNHTRINKGSCTGNIPAFNLEICNLSEINLIRVTNALSILLPKNG